MGERSGRVEASKVRIRIRTPTGPRVSLGIDGRHSGSSRVLYFKMTIQPTRRASTYKARAVSGAPWCRELRIGERRLGSHYRGFPRIL